MDGWIRKCGTFLMEYYSAKEREREREREKFTVKNTNLRHCGPTHKAKD